jgi:hypothetical protein
MSPQYENQMIRACLAALVRRTGNSLVVRYDEIDHDFDERELVVVCDGDALCVRISLAQEGE